MNVFVGHTLIRKRFERFLRSADSAKTFLLYGPKYSGKATLAHFFARAFVCGRKEFDFSLKQGGALGDIVRVIPEIEEGKHQSKKRLIDVDTVREGIRKISLSSSHNGRKVFIVDEAQSMTNSAQNALLKTLEEPIGNTMIILVAHTTDTLLPTILSRCESERFGIVSKEEFFELFPDASQSERDRFQRLSMGLPGLAIRITREKEFLYDRMRIEEQALLIEEMGIRERLRLGEELSKDIPRAIETLELWGFIFRERAFLGERGFQEMFIRVEKMYECVKLLKNTQVNARLILENTILSV